MITMWINLDSYLSTPSSFCQFLSGEHGSTWQLQPPPPISTDLLSEQPEFFAHLLEE